ncbi:uncharacterized protein N7482_000450 [Penicillium canariense]|uniref:Uncharacterized protein n=1 Tax=Penicillium canariense TaxID=189055 RepID=A0A9W9LS12_9EURO|nr:uncharacterized protein N7482_000450 [Penicillium canariense]KAJ5174573.1 hypothetical protein N7482_000450 [Penicillium canariense]
MSDRDRSRSPRRHDTGDRDRPKKTGGFRWKEKRRHDESRGDDRRLDRGYRDRGDRPHSPRRDRDGDGPGDRSRDSDRDRDREPRRRDDRNAPREDREKTEKKEKKKKLVAPQSSEPMIVVHVNDRLGTKAAIPCLASDPISKSSPGILWRLLAQPYSYHLRFQSSSKPKLPPESVVNHTRSF